MFLMRFTVKKFSRRVQCFFLFQNNATMIEAAIAIILAGYILWFAGVVLEEFKNKP